MVVLCPWWVLILFVERALLIYLRDTKRARVGGRGGGEDITCSGYRWLAICSFLGGGRGEAATTRCSARVSDVSVWATNLTTKIIFCETCEEQRLIFGCFDLQNQNVGQTRRRETEGWGSGEGRERCAQSRTKHSIATRSTHQPPASHTFGRTEPTTKKRLTGLRGLNRPAVPACRPPESGYGRPNTKQKTKQ